MKNKSPGTPRKEGAFTLIELLVVISIIGILAALLLTALSKAKPYAKEKLAQVDMANVTSAITQYYNEYSMLPASTNAIAAAAAAAAAHPTLPMFGDFTFGTLVRAPLSPVNNQSIVSSSVISQPVTTPVSQYQNVNSEVMAILADAAYYPEMIGSMSHIYNPQKTSFYNGRPATDTNSPGVGPDWVLRDPFGMPYIITLDLNYDGKCYDPIWTGTLNMLPGGNPNFFVSGSSMIWSFGQLKTINLSQLPNGPINKHLLKSWQ